MRSYIITAGTFRQHDDSTLGVGDTIELEDDIARLHADKLRAVPEPEPSVEEQQPSA